MKVGEHFHTRQIAKLSQSKLERMCNQSEHAELPFRQIDVRLLAEIEDGPVLYQVLANRHERHAVAVTGPGTFGRGALKPDVYGLGAHLTLTFDVPLPAFDNLAASGIRHYRFTFDSCSSASSSE